MLKDEIQKQFVALLSDGEEGIVLKMMRDSSMELSPEWTRVGNIMKAYWEEARPYPTNVRIMLFMPKGRSWKIRGMRFFNQPEGTVVKFLGEVNFSNDSRTRRVFFESLSAKLGYGEESVHPEPAEWEKFRQ